MLICLSGRYIEQELALHYGHLPPSFLPVGGERLFSAQARAYCAGERAILTLPDDYEIAANDQHVLAEAGFEVFAANPRLDLTEAIDEVLRHVGSVPEGEPVRILFGDTLVDLEASHHRGADFVAVKPTKVDYPWTYGDQSDGTTRFFENNLNQMQDTQVVCGYFSFSDLELLRQAVQEPTLCKALNAYSSTRELQLVDALTWHDFGHIALFYESKRDLLVTRAFNSLDADDCVITKTSEQTVKMQAEAIWFETVPPQILLHTPRFIGRKNKDNKAGYQLEYLHLPTLSEMAVFGRQTHISMGLILSRCVQLLASFRTLRPEPDAPEASPDYAARFYDETIRSKTWSRLQSFCDGFGCDLQTQFVLNGETLPPLGEIVATTLAHIPQTQPKDICFWHGDFFFGNLFFDFNTQRVIMIDPRGMSFDNVLTQYGDIRYDIGKLAHSVLGGYDHIIANQAQYTRLGPYSFDFHLPSYTGPQRDFASDLFCRLVESEFGIETQELYALTAIMFFSMLPLHQENPDRQAALFANGLLLSKNLSI